MIAVDVIRPGPLLEAADPVSVGTRAFRLVLRNTLPQGADADVLVLPPISPRLAATTFRGDPRPLLEAGLQAGLAAPPAATTRGRSRVPGPPPDRLESLQVAIDDPATAPLVRRAFRDVVPGSYDPAAVLAAMDRLHATGLFDALWPTVVLTTETAAQPDGTDVAAPTAVAVLQVTGESAAGYVAGGAGYDRDRGGRTWAAAGHRPAGRLIAGEVAVSIGGIEQWATFTATRPLSIWIPARWAGGAHLQRTLVRGYVDRARAGTVDVLRSGGWLGIERPWVAPERLLSVRGVFEWVRVEGGEPGVAMGPAVRFELARHPTHLVGGPTAVEADVRWGELRYERVRLQGSVEGGAGRTQWAAVAEVAAAGGDPPLDALPALGDDRAMPGLAWGEYRGRRHLLGGFDLAYPAPLYAHLRVRARAALVDGIVDPGEETDRLAIAGLELAAAWATPFGSVVAGFGVATRGHRRIVIDIGTAF